MTTIIRRRLGLLLGLLAAAAVVAGVATSAALRSGALVVGAKTTMVCTSGTVAGGTVSFRLRATEGTISTPDGNSIYMWGYENAAGTAGFQMPGPVLCVNEGQRVEVTLTNALAEPVSVIFPGQENVDASGGVAGLLTREAAPGGSVTYSFTASEPGTYLYESGTDMARQLEMGLYGALVVRPALGARFAYNHPSTEFDPTREYLLLLHEIDPELHLAVERGGRYDRTKRHERYWTITGRSFPDTIAPNGAGWLPEQPYGSMVRIVPDRPGAKPALIRFLNAGLNSHPFHPHGNHVRVIAQDGRLLRNGSQDTSFENFTRTIASGQTYDMLIRWVDREGFNPTTNKIPVVLPPGNSKDVVYKDKQTMYSGNPYLGRKSSLPAGVVSYNSCGEYYFPLHSHALNEFQNFNEGFGGMATMLRVDPPTGCSR